MTLANHVPIKALAAAIGLDRSNTLKYVKKLGFSMVRRRCGDTRGQFASCLSLADAQAVITHRQQGIPVQPPTTSLVEDLAPPVRAFADLVMAQSSGDFEQAARSRHELAQLGYTFDYQAPGTVRPRKAVGQ